MCRVYDMLNNRTCVLQCQRAGVPPTPASVAATMPYYDDDDDDDDKAEVPTNKQQPQHSDDVSQPAGARGQQEQLEGGWEALRDALTADC